MKLIWRTIEPDLAGEGDDSWCCPPKFKADAVAVDRTARGTTIA